MDMNFNKNKISDSRESNLFICESQDCDVMSTQRIKKMIRKLYYYPIIAIFIWTIASCSRMYEYIVFDMYPNYEDWSDTMVIIRMILYTAQVIVMSGRGFIYGLVYFLRYEKLQYELIKSWHEVKIFFCCSRNSSRKISLIAFDSTNMN
jgi:hypothetical protein